MNWGSPTFVLAIIALSYAGWIINNWINGRDDEDDDDYWEGRESRADSEKVKALEATNQQLRDELATIHQRMAALETIVTDKGYSLSAEIEALRDLPAPGRAAPDPSPKRADDAALLHEEIKP